ncbi:oxaloacetate decarboxylase subunit alpha [Fusobacterium sp. PH5-44]|uniref:oxaloacetate decarboxylase subunit alpha n=1 Tax=unclassified Fusobacterium TaxID=2648384 RepID=UPI003D1AB91C
MKPLKMVETALRDGAQSLIATRMKTEEMLPIIEKMDQVGYYSMEVWGGATFDSCIRFLNEDPWERLREIKKRAKNTKLQMLVRGQNLVGYRHYADDIVELFIKKALANGIDIIRAFDALNDFRNLETTIKSIKKYNGHCQGCIAYATSDVHTLDYYVEKVKDLEKMGADSICIKDMSGILLPNDAYTLVKKLKEVTKLPIDMHTHCTSGVAQMMYMKAVEAGADMIDTAISPLSGGTAQPATEVFAQVFKGTDRDPKLNIPVLEEIADYFKPIMENYRKDGTFNPKAMATEPKTLLYQVPGGMLSNLMSQLEGQGNFDKYEEVLREIPKVREDLGYPPLVTPLSQMVGTQAVFNVVLKERYKVIPKEIKDYVRGNYGKPPAPISLDIQKKIIGEETPITDKPSKFLLPEYEKAKQEIGTLAKSDEDVLMYAIFPENARKFLENRANPAAREETLDIAPVIKNELLNVNNRYETNFNNKVFNIEIVGK